MQPWKDAAKLLYVSTVEHGSQTALDASQLERALEWEGVKTSGIYMDVLRGLLLNVPDDELVSNLGKAKSTIANKKTEIRKDLNALLDKRGISSPTSGQDGKYLVLLNQASLISDLRATTWEVGSSAEAISVLSKSLEEDAPLYAITSLLEQIENLLDILRNPLSQAMGLKTTFLFIATEILRLIGNETNKEPRIELSIALISQAAYLESIRQFLEENKEIRAQLQETRASKRVAKLIGDLDWGKLDDRNARDILLCFHESWLSQTLNPILVTRLQESGLAEKEAKIVTERISRGTHRYVKRAIADIRDEAKKLTAIYGGDLERDLERQESIDLYLQEVIAHLPRAHIFDERFILQDLYIPMKVLPVIDTYGNANEIVIEEWAENWLLDDNKRNRVLFLQAGPGRGKSVFCRMFADLVRRHLQPIWTPIAIRLQDITTYRDFEKTLAQAVGWDFANEPGWLSDRNTRFLFFLDGFDELLLERGDKIDLREFLDQVTLFQQRCGQNPDTGHRIVITGRPLALFGIDRQMPSNLERVELQLMSDELQSRWLAKWEAIAGPEKTDAFRAFLNDEECPSQVKNLAREPLLLYLLATMHRDDAIAASIFTGKEAGEAKVVIYEAALEWVLERQRSQAGRNLNVELAGLEREDLQSLLAETALCVAQSGGNRAKVKFIEERLRARGDVAAKELIETARKAKDKLPLKNALATFYLRASEDNSVEFFHKSFSEYLCAVRFCDSLHEWMAKTGKRRKTYAIADEQFEWQVYDMLGYGGLTLEIVEYVRVLLQRDAETDWETLYERLNDFYLCWSDGEFIERASETLPQKKTRQLQQYGIKSGQREVDVYTGLNVLILLLDLHQHAKATEGLKEKISFHPCGREGNEEEFDREKLLRIISYSECVEVSLFQNLVGKFFILTDLNGVVLKCANLVKINFIFANLRDADFRDANLSSAKLHGANLDCANFLHANLSGANLSDANFSRTDLSEANLSGANLSGANLSGANLSGANLSGANLSGANLNDVILSSANLSKADLNGADLSGANLVSTVLTKIQWNQRTEWFNTLGINEALDIPKALTETPKFSAAVFLNNGFDLAREGKISEAIATYTGVQNAEPNLKIAAVFWNNLCRYGCKHNRAVDVLFAGEKAVELEPENGKYRDTRGLAIALTGNFAGAAEDFQVALESNAFDYYEEREQRRKRWLAILQMKGNPFTPEEISKLWHEEG